MTSVENETEQFSCLLFEKKKSLLTYALKIRDVNLKRSCINSEDEFFTVILCLSSGGLPLIALLSESESCWGTSLFAVLDKRRLECRNERMKPRKKEWRKREREREREQRPSEKETEKETNEKEKPGRMGGGEEETKIEGKNKWVQVREKEKQQQKK